MRALSLSETAIAWLIEKSPLLLQAADSVGNLPLHILADKPWCPAHVLDLFIEKYPRALQAHGQNGNLPLHNAVGNGKAVPKENVQYLLDKCPGASYRVNEKGQLPLHLACAINANSNDVIDLLVASNPEGLSMYDNDGCLPFHLACLHNTSPRIVNHLIKKLDGAILPSTKDGVSSLFLACERDANLNVIFALVRHSQEMFSSNVVSDHCSDNESTLACSGTLRSRRKRRKTSHC